MILKHKVLLRSRLKFLPKYFDKYYMWVENYLYSWMERNAEGYDGGYFEYYDLTNGGFLIIPSQTYNVSTQPYVHYDKLTPEQVGLTVCIFICGHFSHVAYKNNDDDFIERFSQYYQYLYDYGNELSPDLWRPVRNLID